LGADFGANDLPEKALGLAAFRDFFTDLRRSFPAYHRLLWDEIRGGEEFTPLFEVSEGKLAGLKVSVHNAAVFLVKSLARIVRRQDWDNVMLLLVVALEEHGVPVPDPCLARPGVDTPLLTDRPYA